MNNEIRMFREYSEGSIDCYNQNDKKILIEITNKIDELIPFENPDIILKLDDKIMMIEHFQFDASKYCMHKGNLDKALLPQRERAFDEFSKNNQFESKVFSTTRIDCIYTYQQYTDNFKRVYYDHLCKIDNYKKRIIEHGYSKDENSIITAFLIIDTTPLGNYCLVDGSPITFSIFQLPMLDLPSRLLCL
jgi:hypothetical protein